MSDEWTRTLTIDGEVVEFKIELAGQVWTAREGGAIPTPEPFLGATAFRDGQEVWSGVLTRGVAYPARVSDHYTDEELIEMYRGARPR